MEFSPKSHEQTQIFRCFFFSEINLDKTDEGVFTANFLTCIINVLFSVITCTGNLLVLLAIGKTRCLHTPSFVLLGCLAASDLLVGLICQPLFVASKIAELMNNFSLHCTLRMLLSTSSWITSGASSATMVIVSVDRLLVLTLHLRYNSFVTVPRVFQTVLGVWICSITFALLRFPLRNRWYFIMIAILLLGFLVLSISTYKIFHIVRRHQRQIRDQNMAFSPVELNTVNVFKCRRSAVTVIYVYGLSMILYIPHFVTIIVATVNGYSTTIQIAYTYVYTVIYINSFLNPFVYCWRNREIRRAVKNIVRRESYD